LSGGLVERWLRLSAERVADARVRLTELDAAIGDGDHGINLDRGFRAVLAGLHGGGEPVPGPELLRSAGRTVMGTVGGASGALYGRALVRAGERLADRPAAHGQEVLDLADAFEAAVESIAALGRARPGDKTMLDALLPATAALRSAATAGLEPEAGLAAAADAAARGARATIPLLATRGRASYLGDRSIGHLDPGAASSALLVRALADAASS
jgi:dihydroxyacetone kinase-like protein